MNTVESSAARILAASNAARNALRARNAVATAVTAPPRATPAAPVILAVSRTTLKSIFKAAAVALALAPAALSTNAFADTTSELAGDFGSTADPDVTNPYAIAFDTLFTNFGSSISTATSPQGSSGTDPIPNFPIAPGTGATVRPDIITALNTFFNGVTTTIPSLNTKTLSGTNIVSSPASTSLIIGTTNMGAASVRYGTIRLEPGSSLTFQNFASPITSTSGSALGVFGRVNVYNSSPLLAPLASSLAVFTADSASGKNAYLFQNNSISPSTVPVGSGGGAVYNANSTLVFTNATFSGNRVDVHSVSSSNAFGGAIYSYASPRNSGLANGSIDYAITRPKLYLDDVAFTGNYASAYTNARGGALTNDGGTAVVNNAIFSNNKAFSSAATGTASGGAIANISSNITIATPARPATLILTNSRFTGNESNQGGAVANTDNASPTASIANSSIATAFISNVSFEGNRASDKPLDDSLVTNKPTDSAPFYAGGAIFNGAVFTVAIDASRTGGTMTLLDVTFKNNSAVRSFDTLNDNNETYGGAIYNSGVLAATNALFIGNLSRNKGGAVYNTPAYTNPAYYEHWTTFSNALFDSNRNDDGKNGGSNESFAGGAIYTIRGKLALQGTTLSRNTTLGDGGALYSIGTGVRNGVEDLVGNTRVAFTDATFTRNSAAHDGGAIANVSRDLETTIRFGRNGVTQPDSPVLTLTNVSLTGNRAGHDGGAIYNDDGVTNTGKIAGIVTTNLINTKLIGNAATGTGGAIYNSRAVNLSSAAGQTSLITGNYAGTTANFIALVQQGQKPVMLTVATDAGTSGLAPGVLDMRDPFTGASGTARGAEGPAISYIAIDKTGAGIWKLGGANSISTTSNNGGAPAYPSGTGKTDVAKANPVILDIQAGTLYLYRAGEVSNSHGNSAVDSGNTGVRAGTITLTNNNGTSGQAIFTLGTGATLAAGGGNSVTSDTITLAEGSRLAFDLAHHDTAMLTLALTATNAGTFTIGGANSIPVELLSLNKNAGTYTLVSGGGNFTGKLAPTAITLRGEAIAGTRAPALSATGGNGANGITLTQSADLVSAVSTWKSATPNSVGTPAAWSIAATAPYWTNKDSNGSTSSSLFLHGDVVNFANTSGTTYIALNPAGDHTVRTAGLYFRGAGNYEFQVGSLEADTAASTSLTGAPGVDLGKLVLGASANNTANATQVAVSTGVGSAANSFSGTVDLRGTSANTFSGGVDIYSGTLLIDDATQLGTSLSQVRLLGDPSISTNTPTLRVPAGKAVSFTGVGDASQRLTVEAGKFGAIQAEIGSTVIFDYSDTAVAVAPGGRLELRAAGAGFENGHFIFRDNTSTGAGGAISSAGNLTITNTTFTRNEAAVGGGAVNTSGTGHAEISDSFFFENKAAGTGGAVRNTSTGGATFTNVIFDSNTAQGLGGAIYSNAGTVKLITETDKVTAFVGNRTGVDASGTGGTASAIHLDATSNRVGLEVEVEDSGKFYLPEPITTSGSNTVAINKTGVGTWNVSGANNFARAEITISEGAVELYGDGAPLVAIKQAGALRDEVTAFDYEASVQMQAGSLNLNAGSLRVGTGATQARLTLSGSSGPGLTIRNGVVLTIGSAGIVTSETRSVTLAPGATVVFQILGTADSVGGLTTHGSIAANNLVVSGRANLVLDLSGANLDSFLVGQPGDAPDGTLIKGLFTNLVGTMLTRGEAGLGNITIQDSSKRYSWVMLSDGSIKAVGDYVSPPPLPEPSTYALLGGLGALGFALWRKRRSAGAKRSNGK